MFDFTKWLKDEILEDHVSTPIVIVIHDLSEKYDVEFQIIAKPKSRYERNAKKEKK